VAALHGAPSKYDYDAVRVSILHVNARRQRKTDEQWHVVVHVAADADFTRSQSNQNNPMIYASSPLHNLADAEEIKREITCVFDDYKGGHGVAEPRRDKLLEKCGGGSPKERLARFRHHWRVGVENWQTSKYTGVYYNPSASELDADPCHWAVQYAVKKKDNDESTGGNEQQHIVKVADEAEAGQIYDQACILFGGEPVNFTAADRYSALLRNKLMYMTVDGFIQSVMDKYRDKYSKAKTRRPRTAGPHETARIRERDAKGPY
jgi:hypothetical protein